MQKWPTSRTVTDVQSLLELLQLSSDYIQNVLKHVTILLSYKTAFPICSGNEMRNASFRRLKIAVAMTLILIASDLSETINGRVYALKCAVKG